VADNYASAVRAGTMAAGRMLRDLGVRELVESSGEPVDVFGAIYQLGLPLMLRPLQGLLGVFLPAPMPGILVTTERPMSIQRFTAAHELGHFAMGHRPSLDDENNILRRAPLARAQDIEFQETEADAFATAFMMPRWLVILHCQRQGWRTDDLIHPAIAYQLSVRLGASYEATCRSLERHNLITGAQRQRLLSVKPRELKVALLGDYQPPNYRGDVWRLTARDQGGHIAGSRNDLFVLQLEERSSAGYVWNVDQLAASGFAIVRDQREAIDDEGIGNPVLRKLTVEPVDAPRGHLRMDERRPWSGDAAGSLDFEFDLSGPEEAGLSRFERRRILEEL
jgi:predicted secreted protein